MLSGHHQHPEPVHCRGCRVHWITFRPAAAGRGACSHGACALYGWSCVVRWLTGVYVLGGVQVFDNLSRGNSGAVLQLSLLAKQDRYAL
jgi:hypothetical protein